MRDLLGAGRQTLTGTAGAVQKTVVVTVYERFPQMAFFEVRYTNQVVKPGGVIETFRSFAAVHQGDYFQSLRAYSQASILGYVVHNALQFVPPEHLHIVVGCLQEEVRQHLGLNYGYAVQETPTGTGGAVRQAAEALRGFENDLLILYGDTPLFRPASIRGLLKRHYLKKADLTLLTAVLDRSLPYGRINPRFRPPSHRQHRRRRRATGGARDSRMQRGRLLGKDGIFACALVVEMLARTGKKVSQLLETVHAITGLLYSLEETFAATPEMRTRYHGTCARRPAPTLGLTPW